MNGWRGVGVEGRSTDKDWTWDTITVVVGVYNEVSHATHAFINTDRHTHTHTHTHMHTSPPWSVGVYLRG